MNNPAAAQKDSVRRDPVRQEAFAVLRDNWGWLAGGASILVLVYFLGPILTPFLVSATLAYLGDPLVDRLERLKMSRTLGVAVVFLVLLGGLVLGLVLVVPMLEDQVVTFFHNVPDWLKWVQNVGLPKLGIHLPPGVHLDAAGLRNTLTHNWSEAGSVAETVLNRIGESTPLLIGVVANLVLIPIVTFYLLRDWDVMVAKLDQLIPTRLRPHAEQFALETDKVLSALIRGQLSVMAALSLYYCVALWIAGLNIALLVGLITGLFSFIPYLGYASGFAAAAIAMLVQNQELYPLLWIVVVYAIGQVLESAVLTPKLVGDRIGLHPVAVIFAILAGGQLFGFVGVLVALPMAAVVAVLLRHALARWLRSPLYLGAHLQDPPEPPA